MPSIADIGLGKVGSNSHPIHPSTVHLPIAFLLAGSGLDILSYFTTHSAFLLSTVTSLSSIFTRNATPIGVLYHLSLFSYASTIAGIFTSFPAITSGLFEFYDLVQTHGLDFSNQKIKITSIHAALNDVALFGAVYNVISRYGREAWISNGKNTLVSMALFGGVGYAAFLGGGLVYTHGVGVQRMGKGKEEKEASRAKEIAEAKKEL
ncbi:uncharacterized protein RAG0_00179 [Rhynchosporium agropyri]|uniref:DUF2231 domain-containing protein n=1 Tax=Rhynchosporium agropyri TaxID=914238 RepID=A0A1E1JVZ5_9HELO|nr:uncharacterized protein RAG0_00179 [Rhynchosporium agropyri]